MKKFHLVFVAAALLCGCRHPAVRVPERERDTTTRLDESPLLLDLPEDVASEETHTVGSLLSIADDERFLLEFPGTPLRDALGVIGTMAGVTLLCDASIDGIVEARFEDITLDDALQTLLRLHELTLLPGPGDVYFVERTDDASEVTDFVQLVNVRAADVSANLTSIVSDTSRVIVDSDRNVICIIGTHADVATVRRYLQHIDTLKDQVLLEVHLFEVTYEDGFDFGSVLELVGSSNSDAWNLLSNFGQGGDFSTTLTDNDGDFDATIDAVRRYIGLELVSSPRVLAITNTAALVDVVREIPYIETTSTTTGTTGGVGSTVQESVQFKEAGLKLQITPSIQEHGYLQVAIDQSISEEIGRFNDIPIIDRRTLTTQFLVEDRQTIVLGGLMQERQSEERRGVPLLMHLPFVGQFFRSDTDAVKKQELLVFVTPRILSPRQAAALAPHYRSAYKAKVGELGDKDLGVREMDSLIEPQYTQ
jgi:general secretion pathway protein D